MHRVERPQVAMHIANCQILVKTIYHPRGSSLVDLSEQKILLYTGTV